MMKKTNQKEPKKIMSHEKIYQIMQWMPVAVAGLFFLKNVIGGDKGAMVAIGVILAAFIGIVVFVRVRKVSLYAKEFTLALTLPVLVASISLYSGASYSDDFSLFLAVIALTGVYLEPKFTQMQIVEIDLLLVIMYLVHPEKAGGLSQYILCVVVFTLAACLNYILIKRGQGFIRMSEERAEESEKLLSSIRSMGADLQQDFAASSEKIEVSTEGLQAGSVTITKGVEEVSESCTVVKEKIAETGEQIDRLNDEVGRFESALNANQCNVEAMSAQMETVSETLSQSGEVFRSMEAQMNEIAGIAKQISDISFKLTILSLNASVEAGRAGEAGAGFEVLATEMRALSETSTLFSGKVSESVRQLLVRVEQTSEQFAGSETALKESQQTMSELVAGFEQLNKQFDVLYDNIECQNDNVNQVGNIFENLNYRVAGMYSSSQANQTAVDNIVDAMAEYKSNIGRIVENTQSI